MKMLKNKVTLFALSGILVLTPAIANTGKTVQGFKVSECSFRNDLFNFCNPKTVKSVINTSKNSKNPLFMSKYNIVTLNSTKRDPAGELVSTFVFVDLKEKTILTQPFQSEYQARVDCDTKGNKIRVFWFC